MKMRKKRMMMSRMDSEDDRGIFINMNIIYRYSVFPDD